jgi:tetratricopeptide (TPR) repeat protein
MADDIRAMTAELAADPTSLVFLELADALRRRGQLEAAHKVTRNGLARYPELAAGHDLAARIFADRGELDRAFEAWVTALKHDPALLGAHKGLGFLYFRANDLASAEKHLAYVAEADPADAGAAAALERLRAKSRVAQEPKSSETLSLGEASADGVQSAPPALPHPSARPPVGSSALPFAFDDSQLPSDESVFAGLEGGSDSLLLVDGNGLRLGGGLRSPGGEDVADAVAAQLAGVAKEAARTARLLALGEWRGVAIEAPGGSCYLVTPTPESLLFTARGAELPMGRVVRLAERAAAAARRWLERMT